MRYNKKMIYIIVGIVILVCGCFLVKYYFFSSTRIFTRGHEVFEKGIVINIVINSFKGEPPFVFTVKNANNVEFKVNAYFTNESVNSIKKGDIVDIYGKIVKTGTISLFNSKNHYIKKIILDPKNQKNTMLDNKILGLWAINGNEDFYLKIDKEKIYRSYLDSSMDDSFWYRLENGHLKIEYDNYEGDYLIEMPDENTLILKDVNINPGSEIIYHRF